MEVPVNGHGPCVRRERNEKAPGRFREEALGTAHLMKIKRHPSVDLGKRKGKPGKANAASLLKSVVGKCSGNNERYSSTIGFHEGEVE